MTNRWGPLRPADFLIAISMLSWIPNAMFGEPCRPVEVRNPEGNYIVPGTWGEIVYAEVDGRELALDAYVQQGRGQRPAVVVVHGGNWTSGSRIAFVPQFLEMLTAAGFNWFSIDYRLAPRHPLPAALDDLREALAFIRCNASRFSVDPERIAFLGDDAGGHLAALLATEGPLGVRTVVTFGAPFDLRGLERLRASETARALFGSDAAQDVERVLEELSPATRRINEEVPSFLAVFGTADREVPPRQAEDFCRIVTEGGGRCDLLPVEGGGHLPENWPPHLWGYKDKVVRWLADELDHRRGADTPYVARLRKEVAYVVRDVGGGEPLSFDYYLPPGKGPFPAVILVHGGGWEAGSKITYLTPVLEPLARAGFAWFSIDYRLTPEVRHPEQLEDLRRAIRFIRHHAGRFRIDPRRIALLGESAGGQMVAQVAAEPCPPNPESLDPVEREPCGTAAVVSFYGVYDFLPLVTDASPRSLLVRLFAREAFDEEARVLLRRYSPLYHVHSGMPPFLLINGTAERLWEQALQFRDALVRAEVDHELYALEGAPHGMEHWEGRPEWMGYKSRLVAWLGEKLGE